MTNTNRRPHLMNASFLALALAGVGCGISSEPGAEGFDAVELGALTEENCVTCPTGIDSTIVQIGTNKYYISYRATLDAPQSTVWPNVKDFETLVAIAFDGAATDFEWVEGSPGVAPATVEFTYGGQRLTEEVTYINNFTRVLEYILLETPVLGIDEYSAWVDVDPCSVSKSRIEFTRIVKFSSGTDPNAFFDLFMDEIVNIQTYFDDPNI